MGKHEIAENAEGQWPGGTLLPKETAEQSGNGKHRRDDGSDDSSD